MQSFRYKGENPRPCKIAIDVVECSHGLPRRKGVRALLKLGDCRRLGGTVVSPPCERSPGAPPPFSAPVFELELTPADEAPLASYLVG